MPYKIRPESVDKLLDDFAKSYAARALDEDDECYPGDYDDEDDDDPGFDGVTLRALVEETWIMGGFVVRFGPPEVLEALEGGADGEPPAPGRRGLTVLPGPWWPPR